MKTIIVYYSLEGNTDYAADRIADKLGADKLRIRPVKEYQSKGFGKYLDGGRAAMFGAKPELEDYDVNLAKYDRIIIGFPVWAAAPAPPIRTFVEEHRGLLRRKEVAAFACQGGSGAEKALKKLQKSAGVDSFDLEAVFIEPKRRRTNDTDKMIDTFCRVIEEQDAKAPAEKKTKHKKEPQIDENKAASASGGRLRKYLTDWNYKKHAKLCAAVYIPLIAFDMTVSYVIIKKVIDRLDEKEGLN